MKLKKIFCLLLLTITTICQSAPFIENSVIEKDFNQDGLTDKCEFKAEAFKLYCYLNDGRGNLSLSLDENMPDGYNSLSLEESNTGFLIEGTSKSGVSEIHIIYQSDQWIVSHEASELREWDIDSETYHCSQTLQMPYSQYIEVQYDLMDNISSRDGCTITYHIERSFDEILNYLDPKNSDGVKSRGDNDYTTGWNNISGIKRYVDYLEKYPLSSDTVTQYTQMAVWLIDYRLYNEAILVATNVVNYDPNAAYGYFVLGRGYEAIGKTESDSQKALENYQRFVELANQQGIDIPMDIKQRVN